VTTATIGCGDATSARNIGTANGPVPITTMRSGVIGRARAGCRSAAGRLEAVEFGEQGGAPGHLAAGLLPEKHLVERVEIPPHLERRRLGQPVG
jgi:hypothetical protein